MQRTLESLVGIATSAARRNRFLADDVICRELCGDSFGLGRAFPVLETAQGRPRANQSKAEREPDLARTNMEKEPEPFAMEDEPHHGDCRAENQSGAKVEVARAESNWDRPQVTVYSSLTPEFSCGRSAQYALCRR